MLSKESYESFLEVLVSEEVSDLEIDGEVMTQQEIVEKILGFRSFFIEIENELEAEEAELYEYVYDKMCTGFGVQVLEDILTHIRIYEITTDKIVSIKNIFESLHEDSEDVVVEDENCLLDEDSESVVLTGEAVVQNEDVNNVINIVKVIPFQIARIGTKKLQIRTNNYKFGQIMVTDMGANFLSETSGCLDNFIEKYYKLSEGDKEIIEKMVIEKEAVNNILLRLDDLVDDSCELEDVVIVDEVPEAGSSKIVIAEDYFDELSQIVDESPTHRDLSEEKEVAVAAMITSYPSDVENKTKVIGLKELPIKSSVLKLGNDKKSFDEIDRIDLQIETTAGELEVNTVKSSKIIIDQSLYLKCPLIIRNCSVGFGKNSGFFNLQAGNVFDSRFDMREGRAGVSFEVNRLDNCWVGAKDFEIECGEILDSEFEVDGDLSIKVSNLKKSKFECVGLNENLVIDVDVMDNAKIWLSKEMFFVREDEAEADYVKVGRMVNKSNLLLSPGAKVELGEISEDSFISLEMPGRLYVDYLGDTYIVERKDDESYDVFSLMTLSTLKKKPKSRILAAILGRQ